MADQVNDSEGTPGPPSSPASPYTQSENPGLDIDSLTQSLANEVTEDSSNIPKEPNDKVYMPFNSFEFEEAIFIIKAYANLCQVMMDAPDSPPTPGRDQSFSNASFQGSSNAKGARGNEKETKTNFGAPGSSYNSKKVRLIPSPRYQMVTYLYELEILTNHFCIAPNI